MAWLVTVGPGDAVWERFGHSLLWIHDPEHGTDEAYNYGLFSFEQEHFLLRFVMGHMDYWMADSTSSVSSPPIAPRTARSSSRSWRSHRTR